METKAILLSGVAAFITAAPAPLVLAQTPGGVSASVVRGIGFGCPSPKSWIMKNGVAVCDAPPPPAAPPPPPAAPPPPPAAPAPAPIDPMPSGVKELTVMYGPLINNWAGPTSSPTPAEVFYGTTACLGTNLSGSVFFCDASIESRIQVWLSKDAAIFSALQNKYYNLYLENFPVLSSGPSSFNYSETFLSATGRSVEVNASMVGVVCAESCMPSNLNFSVTFR